MTTITLNDTCIFAPMKQIIISVGVAVGLLVLYQIGKSLYLKPNLDRGEKAAEITGTLPDGSAFTLTSLQGKYILLDFWGSWCLPCRKAHPEMIALYAEFRSASFKDGSGFEIVSYGVERSSEAWKRAIEVDGLPWRYQFHSSALFESHVVRDYNVKQLPTTFLISPEGLIIEIDPSLTKVRKILQRQIL